MPVMDGYEATRQIRRLESVTATTAPKTVIIALTASAFEEQRATILASGCNDLVRKPFREHVIFDKMAEYLGVEYLYEPPRQIPSTSGSSSTAATGNGSARRPALPAEDLQVMPYPWICELHQAATRVNANLVLQLLEQIPAEHVSLTKALRDLVEHYRFDIVVDLTQALINTEDGVN